MIAVVILLAILCYQMQRIWKVLRQIEAKIEDPDDRPKHERFWGNRSK